MMRDILKMCRICLKMNGSRDIFEQSFSTNLLARDDLTRLVEKLRFVTMLKVHPTENLPQSICDLCIVQLNVSYNFKRLALKNDFQIRQYMIENGVSLSKDDNENTLETTTALEIHQIQHNVIRTSNHFRQLTAPEIRRNSTTSSVSGTSTMIINGRENETTPSCPPNNFVHPRPIVRPTLIKVEPTDPDEEDRRKEESPLPATSSPSNSSEPSILTVNSSTFSEPEVRPMVSINGLNISNKTREKEKLKQHSKAPFAAPAPKSIKMIRKKELNAAKIKNKVDDRLGPNLRSIRSKDVVRKSKRKLQKVIKKTAQVSKKNIKKEEPKNATQKIPMTNKKDKQPAPRPRGRPKKMSQSPKTTYKKKKVETNS